jgi:2-phosphoglycerate kinase
MSDDAVVLRSQLRHVRWLGGGSGAGKSTIARRLAVQHGLEVYATDEVMADHAARAAPEETPYLSAFKRMDMNERWVSRSPETMLETFHWFRGEGFRAVVDDLLALPADRQVIAEGFRLLPHLIAPLLSEPGQAVWLLPTPTFRQRVFEARRGTAADIPGRTGDPERALRNLLERDRLFTDRLVAETKRLGLETVGVDIDTTEEELTALVAQALGLDRQRQT